MYHVCLLFVISIVYISYKYLYLSVNKPVMLNTLLLLLLSPVSLTPVSPGIPCVLTNVNRGVYRIYLKQGKQIIFHFLVYKKRVYSLYPTKRW